MTRPVLDASALVALLLGEPGAIDANSKPALEHFRATGSHFTKLYRYSP